MSRISGDISSEEWQRRVNEIKEMIRNQLVAQSQEELNDLDAKYAALYGGFTNAECVRAEAYSGAGCDFREEKCFEPSQVQNTNGHAYINFDGWSKIVDKPWVLVKMTLLYECGLVAYYDTNASIEVLYDFKCDNRWNSPDYGPNRIEHIITGKRWINGVAADFVSDLVGHTDVCLSPELFMATATVNKVPLPTTTQMMCCRTTGQVQQLIESVAANCGRATSNGNVPVAVYIPPRLVHYVVLYPGKGTPQEKHQWFVNLVTELDDIRKYCPATINTHRPLREVSNPEKLPRLPLPPLRDILRFAWWAATASSNNRMPWTDANTETAPTWSNENYKWFQFAWVQDYWEDCSCDDDSYTT